MKYEDTIILAGSDLTVDALGSILVFLRGYGKAEWDGAQKINFSIDIGELELDIPDTWALRDLLAEIHDELHTHGVEFNPSREKVTS